MKRPVKSLVNHGGTSCLVVDVECHIANGLPSIMIIGFASKAVDEAKDRVRASFNNSSLLLPKKKITINLAPADIPKDTTSLDLAIAVSILAASEQISLSEPNRTVFLGELGLDGTIRSIRGVIGRLNQAKKLGFTVFYLPAANLQQANLVEGIRIKPVNDLREVFLDLSGALPIKEVVANGKHTEIEEIDEPGVDLGEIVGQPMAKRALEIAAAGRHNILFHGPPGTGKTMLAKAVCSILPPLDQDEVLEVTHLHSLESLEGDKIVSKRPFRSPHHTASTTSIIGGGTNPKPGEASLAHKGVLFLDELAEFKRSSLESLRQPMEDGVVTISRVKDTVSYPADFILIATQNPCPCGYFGTDKPCQCSAHSIAAYRKKVSGPILDRIDLHLSVVGVAYSRLLKAQTKKQSPAVRSRIAKAYEIQKQRFAGKSRFNSSMSNQELKTLAHLSPEATALLNSAAEKLAISARAYVRTVKVARTIADLAASASIQPRHIAEALQYRQSIDTL